VFLTTTFTLKAQDNKPLPVSDRTLSHGNTGHAGTAVHHKEATIKYLLAYESNHLTTHKNSFIRALCNIVNAHYTTDEANQREFSFLREQTTIKRPSQSCINKDLKP